jgi:hypothetical protein
VKRAAVAVALVCGLLAGRRAYGNGMIISDSRLRDAGPALRVGSGYSLATNRVHGMCFTKATTGQSTYDMDYDFVEITPATLATLDNDARDFVIAHRDGKAPQGMKVHELLGVLTVDEVSAPLADEAKGLSDDARNLLRRGDLTGFLTACGTHYVRVMKRRSRYLTVFSYVARDNGERDAAFERELMLAVTAFDADKERSATEASRDASVSAASMAHSLRVSVTSIGLGSQATPSLPFDLTSYRAALQEAFRASQLDGVGDPVGIEIAPWISQPIVLEALDGVGHGATYAQKQLLREVADFYLEIHLHTDEFRALLMRARHCRRNADWRFREEDGSLRAGLDEARIVRDDGAHRPLADLLKALTDEALAELETAERAYSRGGAGACLAKLEESGLKIAPSDIPECVQHRSFTFPTAHLIEQYCPARLYVAGQ